MRFARPPQRAFAQTTIRPAPSTPGGTTLVKTSSSSDGPPGASGYARLRPRESAPKGARRFPAQTSVFDLKISDRFVPSQNRDRIADFFPTNCPVDGYQRYSHNAYSSY